MTDTQETGTGSFRGQAEDDLGDSDILCCELTPRRQRQVLLSCDSKKGEVLSGATLRDMGWSDRDVLLQVTLRRKIQVAGRTMQTVSKCQGRKVGRQEGACEH